MTTTKSRLIPTGGLILGLALLVAAPLVGWELRPTISTPQNRQGAAPAPTQAQPPPAATTPQRPGEPQRSGGPPRPGQSDWLWWKDADIQKSLGLTEAKVKNISRIFDDRVKRALPLAEKLEKERAELDRLTAEQKVSVDEYAIQVMQVEALRSELSKSRIIMNYRIYRELTPDQYRKLEEIRDKHFSGRGRGSGSRH